MDYGIDISHWNAVVDAHAVRANGITYAWCKSTEGTGYVDPTFAGKVGQLRAAGIAVGAYHFMRGEDPRAQARHFRTVAAVCLIPGSVLPMLDMESADARGSANEYVRAFYDELGPPVADVYGNLDWWRNVLRPAEWGARNILGHIARYNGDPGNPGWTYPKLAVHQHTSGGKVPGIPGNVDRNATMAGYSLNDLLIGNVQTGQPAEQGQDQVPAHNVDLDIWIVRPGDTLSRIASTWNVTVSELAVANGISNPDLIHLNQVIHRPGISGAVMTPESGTRYQVRPGETLSEIAARFGTTVAALVTLNHIANPDRVYAGQWLTLPRSSPQAVASNRVYIVQNGGTLGKIAAQLNYPGGYLALASRNNIANPNRIYLGQRIYY
jgi:LysM repeat protein